jgi:hypothetical protein
MCSKTHVLSRIALALTGAACLAAVTGPLAHAAIPPAGTVFQVKTQFEGVTVCASAPFDNGGGVLLFPLVPCDKTNTDQQWRRTANNRSIENVRSGQCLSDLNLVARHCKQQFVGKPGKLEVQQDDQNRVWRQGNDSLSKTYWGALRRDVGGLTMYFQPNGGNGTVSRAALPFTFPTV